MESKGGDPEGWRRGWLGPVAFFAFSLFLLACAERHAGTEVQDPFEIAGVVASEGGGPSAGAVVFLVPKGDAALGKSGSLSRRQSARDTFVTTTDVYGRFEFDTIPLGFYSLWVHDLAGNKAALEDSVHLYKHIMRLRFQVDLKPRKPVVGIVTERSTGLPIQGASCRVKGTPLEDGTDEKGIFKFSLPDGSFDIDCLHGDYDPYSRQSIVTVSDSTPTVSITLTNTGRGPFVPAPPSVSVSKDPVTGAVRISWSRSADPGIVAHSVRRYDIDIPVYKLIEVAEPDSEHYDFPFGGAPNSVLRKELVYSVAAVRKDGSKSEYTISRSNAETVTRGARLDLRFADTVTTFTVGDTARIVGEFSDWIFPADRFAWTLEESQDSLRLVDPLRLLPGSDLAAGRDTLTYPCSAPGTVGIRLTLRDKSGGVTYKIRSLNIVASP
jgi:hypothetical protein